jgi:DNA-binding FadR family transcriptional regulator
MKLVPIRNLPLSEEVLQRLTTAIEEGHFKTGKFLPAERELAIKLGVSRVVVREAAKCLEQRGLVRIQQGIGVEVVNNPTLPVQHTLRHLMPKDKERLYQCAQARLLIEPELAAVAALNSIPSAVKRLKKIHYFLLEEQKINAAVDRDIEFHEAIADLAGNKVLSLMLKSISELGRLSREVTMKSVGVQKAREHHGKILAAIEAQDAARARNAMKSHLQASLEDLF